MQWQLLDAIGPFFRGNGQRRVNWSKIPFDQLAVDGPERRKQWDRIAADLTRLANEARRFGFNALTLDDVAHLAPHPWHGDELNARLVVFREEFTALIRMLHQLGLAVFLTTDAIPLSAGVLTASGGRRGVLDNWFRAILTDVLDLLPEVRGIIVRIGESDGHDVIGISVWCQTTTCAAPCRGGYHTDIAGHRRSPGCLLVAGFLLAKSVGRLIRWRARHPSADKPFHEMHNCISITS